MTIPIISFVGKSGVGKTTVIERLVRELKARGLRVAVVKHHAHATPIDSPGKDSWRMAEAGADIVMVAAPAEIVRFERVGREQSLDQLVARLGDVDLVLTEGFKREAAPKIEVSRAALGTDPVARQEELIAVVSDHPIEIARPRFDLDDATGLADWLCARFGLAPPR